MDCNGICIFTYKPFYYIYLKKFDWSIETQACLVHELNHFVDFVLDDSGIPLRIENTEVRAYYFEYLFTKCLTQLKKMCPKNKIKS